MAIINEDGIVKILNDDTYSSELVVINSGESGVLFVGNIHVPKIYIDKKVFIKVVFEEDPECLV